MTIQPSVRLAWLPVEEFWLPAVAQALNAKMEEAAVPGIDFRTKAPVSMEVAQLSLECIDATPACWSRVGKSLEANRLLWADLTRPDDKDAKREAVKASIVVFDVDSGVVLSRQDGVFANPAQALAGIDGLFKIALEGMEATPVAVRRDGGAH